MDRLSKTGEVLHTGECQLKTGPYVYRYIDSNGKVKYTQSASLEHLRWKESFIDQGLPVPPTPKYSTSGELLYPDEWQTKTGEYMCNVKDPETGKTHHLKSISLEKMRAKKAAYGKPRYTTSGVLLQKGEREDADGRIAHSYKGEDGKYHNLRSKDPSIVRRKMKNIEDHHPELNYRHSFSSTGERLDSMEKELENGQFSYTVDSNGQLCSLTAPDLNTLRSLEAVWLRGKLLKQSAKGNPTVYEYLQQLMPLKKKRVRGSTYEIARDSAERYLRPSTLGNTTLQLVTRRQIQAFYDETIEKIKDRNANRTGHSVIRVLQALLVMVFDYAYDEGLVERDPTRKALRGYDGVNKNKKRPALSIDEQKAVLECFKGTYYEPHIRFMLFSGVRCCELAGLRWSDVDESVHIRRDLISFYSSTLSTSGGSQDASHQYSVGRKERRESPKKHLVIEIGDTKTAAGKRKIGLTDLINETLKMAKTRCKPCAAAIDGISDLIFTDTKGDPVWAGKLDAVIERTVKNWNREHPDQKVPHFTCHILRHTYATNAARQGVYPRTLMDLMGQSSVEITMAVYTDCQDDMRETANLQVESFYRDNVL